MAEITLKIDDMNSQHCIMKVKKTIDGVKGVSSQMSQKVLQKLFMMNQRRTEMQLRSQFRTLVTR